MADAYNVVCPNCDRVNRIPHDRPAKSARCGECRERLFPGKALALDCERFRRHIGRSEVPIVADFWATWCGPCRAMAPVFERAAQELEPSARFIKVDVDAEPHLAAEFGVRGVPALLVFKDGQVAARQSGAMDFNSLRRWVEQVAG